MEEPVAFTETAHLSTVGSVGGSEVVDLCLTSDLRSGHLLAPFWVTQDWSDWADQVLQSEGTWASASGTVALSDRGTVAQRAGPLGTGLRMGDGSDERLAERQGRTLNPSGHGTRTFSKAEVGSEEPVVRRSDCWVPLVTGPFVQVT